MKIKDIIGEMAAPNEYVQNSVWYHGTYPTAKAELILQNGIVPQPPRSKGLVRVRARHRFW